jgi:hypothetical protein
MHAQECAISLSLKMCRSNQSPLAISIQVRNSARPMHLFGRQRPIMITTSNSPAKGGAGAPWMYTLNQRIFFIAGLFYLLCLVPTDLAICRAVGGAPPVPGRARRSTAIFRNALGYRPITRFFATRSFFSLQSVPIASVSFDGFSPKYADSPGATDHFFATCWSARICKNLQLDADGQLSHTPPPTGASAGEGL